MERARPGLPHRHGELHGDLHQRPHRQPLPRFTPEAFAANQPIADLVNQVAGEAGATPAQVALAWLLSRNEHVVPIPGNRKLSRLQEYLAAADLTVSVEALGTGCGLDEGMFNAVPRHHSIWFRLSGALLGSEVVLAAGGVALTLDLGLRWHRFREMAVGLGTAAGRVVAAELLKNVLLSRPSSEAVAAVSNSFPSGHTVVAAAEVVALRFVASQRWRPTVAVVGGLQCVLVGVVTVVQQWHRPSDVVPAYALVAACACRRPRVTAL